MKKRILWIPMVAVVLAAAPAMGGDKPSVSINPSTTDTGENASVHLNASVGGNDAGCTYSWQQTSGTTALNQTNGNGGQKHWELTTPNVNADETLQFQVTVSGCSNSNNNGTAIAIVNVINATSGNTPPTADITVSPAEVFENTTVNMNANGSDANGDVLTYTWRQTAGPAVTLSSYSDPSVTFTAPNDPNSTNGTSLEFELTVSDGKANFITTKSITVKWFNDPPKAALTCTPATVDEGKAVTLNGSGSSDSDDGIASFVWSQVLGYGGTPVTLPEDTITTLFDISAPQLTSKNNKMTFALKVTDKEGLFDSTTCDVFVNDITPPVFSNVPANMDKVEATSAAGATVNFDLPKATDAVDGDRIVSCNPASGSTFALDATTKVTCSASDESNNKAEASFNVTVVDTTPPALALPAPIGPIEGNTLGGATLTYTASASDLVDGSVGVTCFPASNSVFPVGITKVICSSTDTHKNIATGSFNVTVQDTTPPAVNFGGSIADGSSFYFGSVPAAPTCTASDVVSGTVLCTVNGYSTLVGKHTLTATAFDAAGNKGEAIRNYEVLPWTLKGFYSPVDMGGVTNTVKGGSTVPLKFEVFVGSTELTSTSSISSIQTQSVACISMSSAEDPIDALATGSTSLRYDLTAGQFIYNWQTPKLPGTCYIVTATTLDGSKISANFKLK